MNLRIIVAPRAQRQIEQLQDWWRTNRPAARSFEEILEETLHRLAERPHLGHAPYHRVLEGELIRRLPGTPYNLHYVVDQEAGVINIVAAWSGERGVGPPLEP